jgi:hypothetical protein
LSDFRVRVVAARRIAGFARGAAPSKPAGIYGWLRGSVRNPMMDKGKTGCLADEMRFGPVAGPNRLLA